MFNAKKIEREYNNCSEERNRIVNELESLIKSTNEPLEGNIFYDHLSFNLNSNFYSKQMNLFWCGGYGENKICEIGFNAGHSTLLMILGRKRIPGKITIFDIGEHKYTRPCLEKIKSIFHYINFEYVEGDSTKTIPEFIKNDPSSIGTYDVVHVDGGHTDECISSDIINADLLLKINGYLIVDDINFYSINNWVDKFLESKRYKELKVFKTNDSPHRILQKVM